MRKPLIAGNWKMHGSLKMIDSFSAIKNQFDSNIIDIALLPPAIYISTLQKQFSNTGIKWGIQNVHEASNGAFTGEHSIAMAKDFNCSYVILGHSERRTLFGETDELICKKFITVMQNKLTPILCIGETLEQYQKNITMDVLKKQLTLIFNQLSSTENHNFVIAYEPIWAIGTGLSATPEQAQTIHSQIRDLLKKINIKLAGQVRIIYGGSLKSNNAIGLLSQPDIDGGLIGGASLVSEDFIKIGKIAEQECKH